MEKLTLNQKINNREVNSRLEKIKGRGGLGFSCGVYGKTREAAIKNGGSNVPAFNLTQTCTGAKPKFQNALWPNCKWHRK